MRFQRVAARRRRLDLRCVRSEITGVQDSTPGVPEFDQACRDRPSQKNSEQNDKFRNVQGDQECFA